MRKKNVAILISGNGSNMVELIKDMKKKNHPGKPVIVISDNKDALGIKKAKKLGCETKIIEFKKFPSKNDFEIKLSSELKKLKIDIICLAGFMRILSESFISLYEKKILNIHPSILPLFPGLDTHKKALNSGIRVHGATVHFVTKKVDSGKIIAQGITYIKNKDTELSLSKRVLKIEHKLYKKALINFLKNKNDPLLVLDKNL